MKRDANDRTLDTSATNPPGARGRRQERAAQNAKKTPAPRKTKSKDPLSTAENVVVELVTERQGVLGYRYRRLTIEQQGRIANVREFRLQLDYDLQFELATKRRDLVKVRGRRLDAAEFAALWKSISKLHPTRLQDHYEFLDSVNPEELDETVGADGEPIAVSTGEEGPACITLAWGPIAEDGAHGHRKRIIIDRFREPEAELAEARRARRAPRSARSSTRRSRRSAPSTTARCNRSPRSPTSSSRSARGTS